MSRTISSSSVDTVRRSLAMASPVPCQRLEGSRHQPGQPGYGYTCGPGTRTLLSPGVDGSAYPRVARNRSNGCAT